MNKLGKILLVLLVILTGCKSIDPFEEFKLPFTEEELETAEVHAVKPMYVTDFGNNLDMLIDHHEHIIQATVLDTYQILLGDECWSFPFNIAKVRVKRNYKGADLEKTIYVIETGGYYYPNIRKPNGVEVECSLSEQLVLFTMSGKLLEPQDDLLLFLNEFDGPQEELFGHELYYAGEGQGKFFLNGDNNDALLSKIKRRF